MKQFKLGGIILMVVVALIGCQGALQQPPSVCDSIQPGESVICDMSQKIGQTPETVAGPMASSPGRPNGVDYRHIGAYLSSPRYWPNISRRVLALV